MHDNEVEKLHRACESIIDESHSGEAKVESLAVEFRELRSTAQRVREGSATNDDIARIEGAVSEMGHVIRGDLDRALDTLRSIHLQ